ncbi:MAG: uroporphyrinogen decarboxylase family protein [Promethearchaeota archaeon]
MSFSKPLKIRKLPSLKEEVRVNIKDLKKLLFNSESNESWSLNKSILGSYAYKILKELIKIRINYGILNNIRKTFAQIGIKNILNILLLQIHLLDEMSKINRKFIKQGWKPPNLIYENKTPFYTIKEAQKEDGMTSYERFNTAIQLKEPDRIPITPLMDYYYAANNNMSAKEFVLAPFERVFNAVRNTYNRFNGVLDMVHVPMGRLYAFYNMLPLAQSGYYGELIYPDEVPSSLQFIEKGYIDVKDFNQIKKNGLKSIWKPVNLEKITDTQADIIKIGKFINYWEKDKKVPVYASSGIITPLEGLCYLMGIKNWSKAIIKNKEEVKEICDLFLKGMMANNLMMYLFTQVKRTYVCLERVSSTFLSPKNFEELVLPSLLTIIKSNVRNGLTTVFHMDTDWTPFFHYFLEFPKNGKYILHLEDSDIFKAKEMLGDRFCLMGNIQTKLLRFGTEKQIEDYTRKLIEICGAGGGYLMAEGCEVAPDTPMRNMKVWIETTLKYGKYS